MYQQPDPNQTTQWQNKPNFYGDQTQTHYPPTQPGQYQDQTPPPPPTGGVRPDTIPYSKNILYTLCSIGLLALVLVLIPTKVTNGLGISLFAGILFCAFIVDPMGICTVNRTITWSKIHGLKKLLLIFLYLCFFGIIVIVYFSMLAIKSRSAQTQPRRQKIAMITGSIIALFFLIGSLTAPATTTSNTATVTSPQQSAQLVHTQPTAKATIAPSPTPTPKPKPTATPTPVPPTPTAVPQPTQPPAAAPTTAPARPVPPIATAPPAPTGIGGNPYGYDLNPAGGNVIYGPPADLCSYINCIASFDNGTGYVVECMDGMYSQSGGHTGSCSRHGGDKQPLYKH